MRYLVSFLQVQELPSNDLAVLEPDQPIGQQSGPHIAPRGDFYLLVSEGVTYRVYERPVYRDE